MENNNLTANDADRFAQLALAGIDREYPNKPANVMANGDGVLSPREMHPAFFGCFDWHSSVHSHWLLVRLLKLYPNMSASESALATLGDHLTADNLQTEAEYFAEPDNAAFERMYGWAWLLRLATELRTWCDAKATDWLENLAPLEDRIVTLASEYLPRLAYPIRAGQHADTGFALGQIIDYAKTSSNQPLTKLARNKAREFYLQDHEFPFSYEPSGEDFFSSGLNEADLMRRVLPPAEFTEWFSRFLPDLSALTPVPVTDVTDGKLVHLAGLNLSRAWCLQGIATTLPTDDLRVAGLIDCAAAHATAGDQYVFSGHYSGEHWLATFSAYYHTRVGIP